MPHYLSIRADSSRIAERRGRGEEIIKPTGERKRERGKEKEREKSRSDRRSRNRRFRGDLEILLEARNLRRAAPGRRCERSRFRDSAITRERERGRRVIRKPRYSSFAITRSPRSDRTEVMSFSFSPSLPLPLLARLSFSPRLSRVRVKQRGFEIPSRAY